jgi:hypothetical protein
MNKGEEPILVGGRLGGVAVSLRGYIFKIVAY